ncbi:MAG: hypothetical protein LAN84_06505 [Acidobacteriia bacterium]|nr:hypothetical protein [Terriglobia bacterium]
MSAASTRHKLSTTVATETDAYLKALIRRGNASTLAEALDHVVALARRAEARAHLEEATASYFASRSPETAEEEARLEVALGAAADEVHFDE